MPVCIPATSAVSIPATSGVCAAGVVASGTQSGSGPQSPATVYTVPADGFYAFLGSQEPASGVQFIAGSYSDFFPTSYPYTLKYYHLTSGTDITIEVFVAGGWTYTYEIYSL